MLYTSSFLLLLPSVPRVGVLEGIQSDVVLTLCSLLQAITSVSNVQVSPGQAPISNLPVPTSHPVPTVALLHKSKIGSVRPSEIPERMPSVSALALALVPASYPRIHE